MAEHVVVVGAGYAGLPAAIHLGRLLKQNGSRAAGARVTLLNLEPKQELTCELHRVLRTGKMEFLPFLDLTKRAGVDFIEGRMNAIDPQARTLDVRGERHESIRYDHLVVATGASAMVPDIEGIRDFMNSTGVAAGERRVFGFRSNLQAQGLRLALRRLQWGPDLRPKNGRDAFVVVLGGGATGIEVAGEIAAMRGRNKAARVVLVDESSSVLPDFSPIAKRVLKSEFKRLQVETLLGSPATKLTPTELHLRSGLVVPWDLLVVCTGNKVSSSKLAAFGESLRPEGLLCDDDLEIFGFSGHYAVGDVAGRPSSPLAKTAQFAVQEGFHVAERLARKICGPKVGRSRGFEATDLGALVSLGPYSGVARLGPAQHGGLGKILSPFVAGPAVEQMKKAARLRYLARLKLSSWI